MSEKKSAALREPLSHLVKRPAIYPAKAWGLSLIHI